MKLSEDKKKEIYLKIVKYLIGNILMCDKEKIMTIEELITEIEEVL